MADHASRDWRLVREEARPGPMQMALDEVAASTAAAGGPRTVRVYRWNPGTLSLGYAQSSDTVDWAACEAAGVAVTRRQTGGGGIYHDRDGDVSYSIVAPADELPGDLLAAYHELLDPVFDAFDRLGVSARLVESERPSVYDPACYLRGLHPAHDVVVDRPDGVKKVSGNAQYRQRDAVIQHGSVTHARTTDRHLGVFADPPDAATFRERVTSVRAVTGADRAETVAALTGALREWADADEGEWTDDELAAARALAAEKYGADEWVRRT
ncbi:MAG: biotin/lipoate A/B protein ligase family protein [Halobacteriaceae archaeon]